MEQSEEYRKNQRRHLHALQRWNGRFVRVFLAIWSIFFVGRMAAAALDLVAGLGWHFSAQTLWESAAFLAFGGGFWLFWAMIERLISAHVRRTYGADSRAGP
jgi:hypothetical protein